MKLNLWPLALISFVVAFSMQACGGDSDSGIVPEPTPDKVDVTISTPQANDISHESVTVKSVITNN